VADDRAQPIDHLGHAGVALLVLVGGPGDRRRRSMVLLAALRQVLQAQSRLSVRQREERLIRFLEEEIWPLVPPDQLGKPVSKAEREELLGFGEYGA